MPLLGATVTDATLEPEGRLRMALYDHTGTTYALDLQLAALVNVTSDWSVSYTHLTLPTIE